MIRFIRDPQPPFNSTYKSGMVRELGATLNAQFIASGDAVDFVELGTIYPPAMQRAEPGETHSNPVRALTAAQVAALGVAPLSQAGSTVAVLNAGKTALSDPAGGIDISLSGSRSLLRKLVSAGLKAKNLNPFDLQSQMSQPLVTLITNNPTAYAAPRTWRYADAGGPDRARVVGAHYGDTTVMISMGVNSVHSWNPSARSAGFIEGIVEGSSVQLELHTFGLTSSYFPIWVNGIPVHATVPSNLTGPVGTIQIDFSARGKYHVAVGYEQSLGVAGFITDADDTVHPVLERRVPIVTYGDSITAGVASPQVFGNVGISTAISWIGGVNCIPFGQTSIGYIVTGGTSPLTDATRLAKLTTIINAARAPLVVIAGGINDVNQSGVNATTVQAACGAVLDSILANTEANILVLGAWPGSHNNSAGMQVVDNAISAAVSARASGKRVSFAPISGGTVPWTAGTRNTGSTTGGVAGNSRWFLGPDGTHPSAFVTTATNIPANTVASSGVEYCARRVLDAAVAAAAALDW